jgi:hypothetical protein
MRPKSIVRLERIIWKEIFDMACGITDVHSAAKVIAEGIPYILENLEDDDSSWFNLCLYFLFAHEYDVNMFLQCATVFRRRSTSLPSK